MSLPNYLAKIKSSGVYRFVWDKSVVPAQDAETLRLVVGYSEKGPFNTPVYVENEADFTTIYGNISKRLERRGVYFHRLAQQALQAGPILALNIKPFETEKVQYVNMNAGEFSTVKAKDADVMGVYDTNRFWALDADNLPERLKCDKYITIATTDTKENSCTFFMRKIVPTSYEGITIRSWYASQSLEMPEYLEPIQDTDISDYFAEVYVFRGKFNKDLYVGGPLSSYLNEDGTTKYGTDVVTGYVDAFGEAADALADMAADSNSNFLGTYQGILLPSFKDANGNYISLDIKFNADNYIHKMLMKLDESVLEEAEDVLEMIQTVYNAEDVEFDQAYPIYLEGYTYEKISKSTKDIYSECKAALSYKGLREALTNRVDVEYHYLVDTFDSSLGIGCKKELVAIAKAKDNAFAILNFPKMSKFVENTEFKTRGVFDIKKVAKSTQFCLPTEVEGASWCAYYTQLNFTDGSVKSTVPSAALVSNLFMDKWGARQPYYIVAGPTFGRISYSGLIGPDYNFGRSDLNVLEPMGVNAIIYVPRKGTYINSNQTAKQVPVSGLSKVHIRELIIYLQNEIESLLQSYQWELNTQTLRDTIKAKADAICETVKNNGGVYEYLNICDKSNNTDEIIDNEMIILDTEIEPARGAGKMIHQLTIHKTGAMTSTVK
jgi:hypothetical protein